MMGSNELVSVVVSVYNRGDRLAKCLESIRAQTYRNLEIILVDDGSTDGSGRLCDEFAAVEPRARVIHQENRGHGGARNRGLAESKGEYLVFPDGDDYFHKDYVRLMYEAINSGGKEYSMALCDFKRADDYGEDTTSDSIPELEEMDQNALVEKIVTYPTSGRAVWGANWNKLYRRSTMPVPFWKDYLCCEDYDSILSHFFRIENAIHVRKVLYYWVQWPGQVTRLPNDMAVRNECRCQIFMDGYRNIPAHLSALRPQLLADLYIRMVLWKESVRGTESVKAVSEKIRNYEKTTLGDLLVCRKLTLRRKARWLLSLHAPRLLKLLGQKVRVYDV